MPTLPLVLILIASVSPTSKTREAASAGWPPLITATSVELANNPSPTDVPFACSKTRPTLFANVIPQTDGSLAATPVDKGVFVRTPTLPPFVIIKLVAVEEPTTNEGTPAPRSFGLTDKRPHGLVVAMPSLLFVSSQKRFELSCDRSPPVPANKTEPDVIAENT